MKAPLVSALNLPVEGATPSILCACKMVIGLELAYLKRELSFEGAGRRASLLGKPAAGAHATWLKFCRAEAGISDDTAKNYIGSAKALTNRLTGSKWKPAKWLIGQMEKRPSELTEAERADMIECIARAICDSPAKLLLKELRAVEACDIPESLPEARARVIRKEAALVVMKEELRRRELQTMARLAVRALGRMKNAGQLNHSIDQ